MTMFESLPRTDGDFMVVLLGEFGLFWGNVLLRVPRASQRLVAFLALHGGRVRRAAVAGSLWPDASESHACANLRQALARLQRTARKALAASKLELGLAEGVTVDIRHARALARRLLDPAVTPEQSELGSAAVGVLSAELLPDWYDDWVLLEAEDWRQLRLHALEALAGRLTAAGRCGEAAGAARRAGRPTQGKRPSQPHSGASGRGQPVGGGPRVRPLPGAFFVSTLALSPPSGCVA
jgi:DNA-binding SARP family transcriptional activator